MPNGVFFTISRRPVNLQQSGFFYLAIIDNPKTEVWYKCSRLGINSIDNIMKNMVKKTPLTLSGKKLTNHSARKTVVKKIKKLGSKRVTLSALLDTAMKQDSTLTTVVMSNSRENTPISSIMSFRLVLHHHHQRRL